MAVAQWKKEQQKWDSIEVSDDEDDKPKKIKPEGILASQYGRDLLAHEVTQRFYWRAVAAAKKDPSSEEEDEALMAWLITQQNGENPDNQPIAARIIAFHEKRELPSEELVTKVLQALRKRQCHLQQARNALHRRNWHQLQCVPDDLLRWQRRGRWPWADKPHDHAGDSRAALSPAPYGRHWVHSLSHLN